MADITAAFADPRIRAIIATTGGDGEVTVIPHVDAEVIRRNPKPFLGCSDNTNLHHLVWGLGVTSFYGGSTQVHLGAGPHFGDIHLRSLRAALLDGGEIELTDPGVSEDFGVEWEDPRSLTEFGRPSWSSVLCAVSANGESCPLPLASSWAATCQRAAETGSSTR